MKATELLTSEHRVIESVLDTLDIGAAKLQRNEPISPEFFLETADFIKGFADGCHHRKEEGVLFKALVQNGMPQDSGPIGVMLFEHEQGRDYTRKMREAAQRFQSGDLSARQEIVRNAQGYINLLRHHIMKEDNILFPSAEGVIPLTQQDQIWEDFERVEHEETGEGVHEKYLFLAKKLENEIHE